MTISNPRSWWTRRNGRSPASLFGAAGHAAQAPFETLESRVLLSDPGSTFAEAQELILNGNGQATYDDALPDTDDIDMYKFTMSTPDFVTILADAINGGDVYADRVDTQLSVFDYNGNLIGSSTNSGSLTGGTPKDAWFGFVPTAAHKDSTNTYTFYVRVTAENGPQNAAAGLYSIRVDGESTVLTDDGTDAELDVAGSLSRPLEDIVYKLATGSNGEYDSLSTIGAHADPDFLDTRVDVYDATGALVVGDSQSGRLTNAFTVFKGEPNSTYFFRVRSDEFAPGRPTTGSYTLTVDMFASVIDLDPVTRMGYVAGDLAGENRTELYRITPMASGMTIISVEGVAVPGFAPLEDPALTLYDDEGEFIAFSDRFFGDAPQIESVLEGGRSYFAVVDGFEIAIVKSFHILVEANHTFTTGDDAIDDHASSGDFENATPIVWSDWQVAEDNTLGMGPLADHSLVSTGSFTGRIHRGSDSDLFVFVPPVDMLGQYAGNIGAEVDEDSDGLVDRDGDAAQDLAPIPWYEGYRPATRVEIQVQAVEDPSIPNFTWADMRVQVFDSMGTVVYAINDSTFTPALYSPTLNDPAGSLDPARYFADLDPAVGLDYLEGDEPFEGVFSLEVWGGEPYYIEVSTTSGSGRYNAFVAVDGFPDPTDGDNWSTIQSDTPVLGDAFNGIADDTGSRTVSGFTETTNNFNNEAADFARASVIDLGVASGGWTGPTGTANNYLDSTAFLERAFVMGLADYPTRWTLPFSIADGTGATLLAGYDDDGILGAGSFDNTGVSVLRQSGLAGIEHPLDNDLYTFRAAATGYAEIRVNTTALTDWHEEWIASGVGDLVDKSIAEDFSDDEDDDADGDGGANGDPHDEDLGDDPFGDFDDNGFYLDDDGQPAGTPVTPQFTRKDKTYNSILNSGLRIFDNDFEQVGYNNNNTALTGLTEVVNAGNQGDRTFHDRDARVVFPITKGDVYYIQVESGQRDNYQAWQADPTLPVQWQHLIGSYELLVHTIPTITNDDFPGGTDVDAPVLGFDDTGATSITGEIDNNTGNPFDSDIFTFIAPASAEFTATLARQTGETLIPSIVVYRELPGGGGTELLTSGTASSEGSITLSVDAAKGERFFIEVFGAGATEGLYDLDISGLDDADDHADWLGFQAATEVALLDFLGSATAEGSIESNGDSDVFKFRATDITDATITVRSTDGALDPFAEVYEVSIDPYGNPILLRVAFNDNLSTGVNDSQVFVGLTPDRISGLTSLEYPFYYLVVTGANPNSDEGDYEIEFGTSITDDHPDAGEFAYASAIQIDTESGQGRETGDIEVVGDSDLFRFTALAAGTARVTVSRPTGSTFLPKLSILDADGNELDTPSDGSVPGTVEAEVTRGQVYYVLVEASTIADATQDTGLYTVTVIEPPLDDYPNATEWTIAHPLSFDTDTGDAILGTDTLGSPLNPRIDVVGDTDLFTFVTIASGNMTVTFAPLETSIIGMRAELSIYTADFTLVQTVSSSNPGDPVSIVLTGTVVGERYYVLVGDVIGNRTGEYKLTVDGAGTGGGGGGGDDGDIDFGLAGVIDLDGFNADGSANGVISQAGERDLYKFTAPAGGTIFVQLITPRGSLLDATITILDAATEAAVVTFDATGIPGVNAATRFQSAGAGQEYWVIVDGVGAGVGSYTLKIDAEPEVFRTFYPAGFTGPTIREFVSLANPNSFDITYSVILRYETGDRDQTIVSNQVLAAGSRGGVTISDGLAGSPVGARIAPYAVEVQAVGGPIAASMGHFDFGSTTGDAFTSIISPIWSLARLERNPGSVNDFALYFNPHEFDVDVTLTAYDSAGGEITVTTTVGALRRGGLNLNEVLNLPSGVFGAVVTAQATDSANNAAFQGIIVGQSHFDLVNEAGFGLLGDPIGGGLSGAVPSIVNGSEVTSELVLFNPNPFVTTVTLRGQYVLADLPEFTRIITLSSGQTTSLSGADLGMINDQPLGIDYSSNFPITVLGNQIQFGDSDAAASASQAGTGWFFGAAFMNSNLAGESYFETLAIYNPANIATETSVTLFFLDGTSEVLKVLVPAGEFAQVRLHETLGSAFEANTDRPANFDANTVLGRPGLSFFSMFVTAPTPIATSFTHYDLFLQGGWTNAGAALGLINPISSIA